jgi:hypothetical protein
MNVFADKLRQAHANDLTDVPLLLDAADEIDQVEKEVGQLRAAMRWVNSIGEFFVCTRALPWSPLMNLGDKQIIHFDAIEIDGERHCPHCKHRWKTDP